ncbi:hypothetical protein [Gaetbulibacter aestuarii]|uniref:Uncharacterized protein n=1 Tax=Gaetbulibacter aestuarii TaxID=1502358 RepID=A0ABW7N2X7_9FLAO
MNLKSWHYIKFLLKATNQHGVHSPFVYNLVTKCFYDKTKYTDYKTLDKIRKGKVSRKKSRLLYRIVRYFNPQSVVIFGSTKDAINKTILLAQPEVKLLEEHDWPDYEVRKPFDLIYFDSSDKADYLKALVYLLETTTNDTVWIFNHIHNDPEFSAVWKTIKRHKKVRVTIDLFFWGLVFFRGEQVKEHFRIRV